MSTQFDNNKPVDRPELDDESEQDQARRERTSSPVQTQPAANVGDDSTPEHSETPYLPAQASGPARERWQRIQAAFVDDPRKSVTEAHQLVGELTQRIVDAFAEERDELERQWSKGGDVSTEDLRVSLQRYRAFFSRLLPSMEQLTAEKKPLAAE